MRLHSFRRAVATTAAVVAVLAGLTACGDDANNGSATTTTLDIAPGLPVVTTAPNGRRNDFVGSVIPGGTQGLTAIGSKCVDAPARNAPLTWLPADLPLPEGTYTATDLGAVRQFQRGVLVVPNSLREFVVFALKRWPTAGYVLGRGESEPGEAEDGFAKAGFFGAFRASTVYCDQKKTQLFLIWGKAAASDTTTSSTPATTTTAPTTGG